MTSFQFSQPESSDQILGAYDESIASVRKVMPTFDDAAMEATWRVMNSNTELVAMPRKLFLRDVMLNHWYQHRGQFSVYLRLLVASRFPQAGGRVLTSQPDYWSRAASCLFTQAL